MCVSQFTTNYINRTGDATTSRVAGLIYGLQANVPIIFFQFTLSCDQCNISCVSMLIALSVFSNDYLHSCFVDLYLKHFYNVLSYLARSSCFVGSFFSTSWISGLLPPTPGYPLCKINEKTWWHSINMLNYL